MAVPAPFSPKQLLRSMSSSTLNRKVGFGCWSRKWPLCLASLILAVSFAVVSFRQRTATQRQEQLHAAALDVHSWLTQPFAPRHTKDNGDQATLFPQTREEQQENIGDPMKDEAEANMEQKYQYQQQTRQRESIQQFPPFPEHEEWAGAGFQYCRAPEGNESIPTVLPLKRWRSSRHLNKDEITITTQLTIGRLDTLAAQCENWPHAIAAAIYAPHAEGFGVVSAEAEVYNRTSLDEVIAVLDEFHKRMERSGQAPSQCALDIELVTEKFASVGEKLLALYPINAMRNRALLLVRTDVLLLMDVDLLPAKNVPFHQLYATHPPIPGQLVTTLERGNKIVIPAMQLSKAKDTQEMALQIASRDKHSAVTALNEGVITGFHVEDHFPSYGPTDYPQWLSAEMPYSVGEVGKWFEPYILISRYWTPFYDERFRGFFGNKRIQVYHIKSMGYQFLVHPLAFAVHYPHPAIKPLHNIDWSEHKVEVARIERDVEAQIEAFTYVPVTSFAEKCKRD